MHPVPEDHTIMRCCGKLVMAEFQQCLDAALAYWHCPLCDESYQHRLGVIDTARAVRTQDGEAVALESQEYRDHGPGGNSIPAF